MKISRLETHDRLQHLKKDQSANVWKGAEDCLKKNPLSLALQEKSPYIYIFAHPRTHDNGVDKVLYWQPRLSIPDPQDNSYLFRAISNSDIIEVCWIIPAKEMWNEYKKGNVTESNWALWSIEMYKTRKSELEKPHPDDLPEEQARLLLRQVLEEHQQSLKMKKMYPIIEPKFVKI